MTVLAVDVLFYSQVPNPDGVPTDWPARCVEVYDLGTVVASGATRMSLAVYAAYRATRQAAFDDWLVGNKTAKAAAVVAQALTDSRISSQAALDVSQDQMILLSRAIVLQLLAYVNTTNANHNALLTWLGGQTTLSNRAQLTGFQLVQATAQQARDAIKARLANGEADT